MKRSKLPPLSPEAASLLKSESDLVTQPEDFRRRAMLRARAAQSGISMAPDAAPMRGGRRWPAGHHWMLGAAAAIAATLSLAGIRARRNSVVVAESSVSTPVAEDPTGSVPPATPAAPFTEGTPEPASVPAPRAAPARAPSGTDSYALELKLLKPARAALARGDCASALAALTEHERRFRNGRLAEEREALRVTALSGAGRTDEARQVAGAFRKRYPQSVLLSRMKEPDPAAP